MYIKLRNYFKMLRKRNSCHKIITTISECFMNTVEFLFFKLGLNGNVYI